MIRDRLEKRRRAISRIALYGSLALAGVLAAFLLHLASAPLVPGERIGWESEEIVASEAVRLLREYVRIDTSESTGDVAEGARFLAGVLAEAGVESNLEVLGTGDANLWAVVEGEEPGAVVLHHHIDVSDVPDPESWHRPPFAAEIDGPWLYGRGTFDMKSVAIAQLTAFLDVAERAARGDRPRRSVIFLATAAEETGSELGVRWILDQHPELARRFELVLTEGGVVEGRGREEIKYWGTEFAQKRYATILVCDPSRERLEELSEDLRRFGRAGGPERLVDEVSTFLAHYAPSRDRDDLQRLLADPGVLFRDRALFESLPAYVRAMFRTEMYPMRLRRVDGGWQLPVEIHMLPGTELEDVRAETAESWLFHGFDVQVHAEDSALHGSPADHPALTAIERTVRRHHPDIPVGPMFLPWTATDARFFRARGIPSYGFSPFLILTTDAIRVDGADERISLPDYSEGATLYRELLERLIE